MGWVEDSRGAPLPGAVISLFGSGIGGGLVTLSDSAGRFFLPSLPPGSYTLRALRQGHAPAPVRRITVVPNRDSIFTVSLAAVGEAPGTSEPFAVASDGDSRAEELQWLLRHKRRSVLESRDTAVDNQTERSPGSRRILASWLPDLAGSMEVVADPGLGGGEGSRESTLTSFSLLRLEGRMTSRGHFSVTGLLSESETTAWRMAAQFALEPWDGHHIQVDTGYGTRLLRTLATRDPRLDNRGVGAVLVQDRWEANPGFAVALGGRFSYVGFLRDTNYLDPIASLELQRDAHTRIRGALAMKTLVPGGDLLTLSSLASAPAISFAPIDEALRAERSLRFELGMDHDLGPTTLRAHAFYEGVSDQLLSSFLGSSRVFRIANGGNVSSRGMGLTLSRRFGDRLSGSMTYTYGHSWRERGGPRDGIATYGQSDFHDLVAQVEAFIPDTDTRVAAFYRLNSLAPVGAGDDGTGIRSNRFNLQINQGLPFLSEWTRADWDLLLAIRNLYYEASEGAVLDEVAVSNPPTRVLGGIAVRF